MDGRDSLIDALRGFAIVLVIMGHVIAFSSPADFQGNILFRLIYSFHMPLFFLISGFLVYGRFGPTTAAWISKKFMGLIIPYAIFTFIYFYVLGGFHPDRITLFGLISNLLAYTKPDSAWFLPVLFEGFIVLSLLIHAEKAFGKVVYPLFFATALIALTMIDLTSLPGAFQVAYYSPFVVLGYLINGLKKSIRGYEIPACVTGSLSFPILFIARNTASGYLPGRAIYFYEFITAIAGIVLSYSLVKVAVQRRAAYVLLIPGIFSMELYLTHLVVLYYSNFFHVPLWFGPGALATLSGTMIVLAISLAISFLLSYNKVISTFLFGRWSYPHLLKTITL